MSRDRAQLFRLLAMASMVLDAKSQTLREENAKREALVRQLEALEAKPAEQGTVWPTYERAAFGYEQWAARRRADINLQLAAQKALCLQAEAEARLAFGRKSALGRMIERR
jgi:hypothetical protein